MMDKRFLSRGKRNDGLNNEWVDGYYVNVKKPMIYTGKKSLNGNFDWFDVDPATVGRCTGLIAAKSYRGDSEDNRLIFEGDIIWDGGLELIGVVTWGADTLAWMVVSGDDCVHLEEFSNGGNFVARDVSIIGNIHDNPDLLGGDDNG